MGKPEHNKTYENVTSFFIRHALMCIGHYFAIDAVS